MSLGAKSLWIIPTKGQQNQYIEMLNKLPSPVLQIKLANEVPQGKSATSLLFT